jgi:hypothetical protein
LSLDLCAARRLGEGQQREDLAGQPPRLVCPPDPPPTRNAAIAGFIAWAQAHPQYMSEPPVETEFRYFMETWPCKR